MQVYGAAKYLLFERFSLLDTPPTLKSAQVNPDAKWENLLITKNFTG